MIALTPIPFEPARLRPRHDGWTAERQIRFIEVLAASKCVDAACRAVGMSDTSAYELRNRSCGAAFAKAWDVALEYQMDRLEQAAIERAIGGTPRPVFFKGEQVGEWRHYDERLTMFLLRSRRRARYGKWLDALPATDTRWQSRRRHSLVDALSGIAISAPQKHGNPDDWLDEDEEVEESE